VSVKVGVIGVGAMGRNHARVYSELEGSVLLAVSDLRGGALSEVSSLYGAAGFLDYHDILGMGEIEAVSVCVPTTHHFEVVMAAVEEGKHVLVEKPIACNLREAEKMVAAAREAGVKLATGHVERFNPVVGKAQELIGRGVIGEVVSASAKRVGPFPPRIKDVGVTIDLAIHEVDVMYHLFQSPVSEVYANVGSILERCEFEDHAEIMTKFQNGIIGMLEVNWLTPYKKRKLEITGVEGIITIDYIDQTVHVYGKYTQKIDIAHKEPLKEEINSFLETIVNNENPRISGDDGIYALKVVTAAMQSAREKKPIQINHQ
jgi:UDP-N-acetylglucosamine 3-dehydrogenase